MIDPGADPAAVGDLAAVEAWVSAEIASGRGSSRAVEGWARRAVDLAGDDTLARVDQLGNLVLALVAAGRSREALPEARQAVALARHQDPETLSAALVLAAEAHVRANRESDALALLSEAEDSLGTEGPAATRARLLEVRCSAYRARGDAGRARPEIERALAIRQRLDPSHPDTALAVAELGELLTFEGRLPEARDAFRQVVQLLEPRVGPDSPRLVRWLRRLAGTEARTGNLAEAISVHERALALSLATLGAHDLETSAEINDFANARLAERDFDAARRLYQRALESVDLLPEPERSLNAATIHYNLAEVGREEGDLDGALAGSEAALALWTNGLGPEHPFVALALEGLAEVRRRRGELAVAQNHLDRALALRRKVQGDSSPATTTTARLVGELAADRGDVDAAAAAGALAGRTLGTSWHAPAEAARVLALQARVDRALRRDPKQVMAKALAAEALRNQDLRQAVRYLAEADALKVAADSPRALDLALAVAAAHPPAADLRRQMFEVVVRSRGLVFDMTARRAQAAAVSADELARRAGFDAASRRLANLLYRGPAGPVELFADQVAEARAVRDRAERDLALANASFRREQVADLPTFAAVTASLPVDAALVSIVRYEPPAGPIPTAAGYVAFVCRRAAQAPRVVPLGGADALEEAIDAWQSRARDVEGAVRGGTDAEAAYRRASRRLVDRLWRPIARATGSARSVFVVADGRVQHVNLAALPSTPGRYLLETGPRFHYLGAERDLLRLQDAPALARRGLGNLLALGAPAYDADSETIATATAAFARMAPALAEAADRTSEDSALPFRARGRRSRCDDLDQMRSRTFQNRAPRPAPSPGSGKTAEPVPPRS